MAEEIKTIPMLQTFRSVVITNSNNDSFEVTSAVAELNIYEDIYSNVLSGNILYMDDNGSNSDIKFNGNEKITVELYKSADDSEVTKHNFFLYKISDNERIKDGASAYILHFSSFEAELNKNTRVHSAIEGSCSDAVTKLFRFLSTDKALEAESTSGVYKFVMNGRTPLECINWYAGRSISSESKGSYFLFYETLKNGYSFKCVDTLVGKEAQATYRYEPAGTDFLIKDITNIKDYEVIQTVNTLEGIDEQYTTLWNADSIRKKIVKEKFNFDKDKKSTLNKGDSIISSNNKNGFDVDMNDRREAFGMKNIIRNEDRNTHSQTQTYYYPALQPKLSAIRQYHGLKLRFLAFGNNKLQIGQTLNLSFMKTKMFDKDSKSDSVDFLLSGKYLITAIRYIYKLNSFDMSIEVIKDSKAV